MVVGDFRDLFVAIATCAATLIGLLFVALSVADVRARTHPVVRQFRAAAALLAFVNAFAVSLFGLVPTSNIAYGAMAVGVIGLFFAAAGLRATLTLPRAEQRRRNQMPLIVGLIVVFGLEIFYGVELAIHRRQTGAVAGLGYVLIVSLLIGIARAWELVGEWDTGLAASIAVLIGRSPAVRVPHSESSDEEEADGGG